MPPKKGRKKMEKAPQKEKSVDEVEDVKPYGEERANGNNRTDQGATARKKNDEKKAVEEGTKEEDSKQQASEKAGNEEKESTRMNEANRAEKETDAEAEGDSEKEYNNDNKDEEMGEKSKDEEGDSKKEKAEEEGESKGKSKRTSKKNDGEKLNANANNNSPPITPTKKGKTDENEEVKKVVDRNPVDVKEEADKDKEVNEQKDDDDAQAKAESADDKKRKNSKEEEEDNGDGGRDSPIGKRARKSSAAYKPDDFTEKKNTISITSGRGDHLKDIASTKASIEKTSVNSEAFGLAYRFLFASRGKINKKVAKQHLLDFCGYLPVQNDNIPEAKREQEDEDYETKFSKKAYKLTVPQLKSLCDMFDVDRSPGSDGQKVDKDVLIDRLLDFLGAPNEEFTNGFAKNENVMSNKKQSGNSKPAEDDEENIEEGEGDGKLPTDKQLRKWVKAYVACHDMNTATTKHALEVASSKFGVDMKPKKKTIKMFLTEEC